MTATLYLGLGTSNPAGVFAELPTSAAGYSRIAMPVAVNASIATLSTSGVNWRNSGASAWPGITSAALFDDPVAGNQVTPAALPATPGSLVLTVGPGAYLSCDLGALALTPPGAAPTLQLVNESDEDLVNESGLELVSPPPSPFVLSNQSGSYLTTQNGIFLSTDTAGSWNFSCYIREWSQISPDRTTSPCDFFPSSFGTVAASSQLQWPRKRPRDFLDYTLDLGCLIADSNDSLLSANACIYPSTSRDPSIVNCLTIGSKIVLWILGGSNWGSSEITVSAFTLAGRTFSYCIGLMTSSG